MHVYGLGLTTGGKQAQSVADCCTDWAGQVCYQPSSGPNPHV